MLAACRTTGNALLAACRGVRRRRAMSALLSAGPGAPATPPSHAPLPAPSSASSLATLGSRSAFDVLSDGPLEHVLTFLDCKALCVSKVAMRDFLTVTAHPRFVARLKRLRGFDDAPMAPMVDARERSFHLDTAALATTVERVAVFEELRALERNHVAFHLATLTPTRRSARLVAKWVGLLKRHPSLRVRIDAHCGVGAPASIAPEHSVRRALKVASMFKRAGVAVERQAVCKSTSELGRRGQTSEFSSSVKSKSIRLIFGRIDCSQRVLEARRKCSCQNIRIRAH